MSRPNPCKRRAALTALAVLSVVASGCGPSDEVPVVAGVIDRETFIQVYVDLRSEAVRSPGLTISDEARAEVLARHDVDEESLLAFVDAYGRQLEYMNQLWAEVERRIEALPPVPRDLPEAGA